MNQIKNFAKKLWADEGGQGTAEYILLVAIVVGALVVFGPTIKEKLKDKTNEVMGQMDQVTQ